MLSPHTSVGAWCPGPVEDIEKSSRWLRKLNQGLNTGHTRVYERKEEPKGVHLVISIGTASVTKLEVTK
jgi:hypothetical protein